MKITLLALVMISINALYINQRRSDVSNELQGNQKLVEYKSLFRSSESPGTIDLLDFLFKIQRKEVYNLLNIDFNGNFRKGNKLSAKTYTKTGYKVSVVYEADLSVFECYCKESGPFDGEYVSQLIQNNLISNSGTPEFSQIIPSKSIEGTTIYQSGDIIAVWDGQKRLYVCNKTFLQKYLQKLDEIQKKRRKDIDLPPLDVITAGAKTGAIASISLEFLNTEQRQLKVNNQMAFKEFAK
jgi:hypothetical protein